MPFSGDSTEHLQFKNHYGETQILHVRIFVSFVFVLILFGVLTYRFYTLQIVEHKDYVTRADSNRIQTHPLPPTRGLIYDRNGILLAYNRPSYTLSIVKEHVENLEATLRLLGELIELDEADIDTFRKALERRRRPYESVPLRFKLSEEEIARVAVNEYRLEGVEVGAQLVRYYPHGDLFAHTIGYVGRISERELSRLDKEQTYLYSGTHSIGKVGIEKYYEDKLLGVVGWQHVEKNAHGRVLRVLKREAPVPGQDIHLNLDIRIQKVAADALNGERGAVVMMDVQTGGILAMVSAPSFDPNLFVTGISYKDYNALNQSRDLPLFNRTIQGQYPPGSTIKPMLGLGGLESGVVTAGTFVPDPGFYQLAEGERPYRCWNKRGHGLKVDLMEAIVESCDTYFYDMAVNMGIDRMYPLGVFFGLGRRTGVDIPNERGGLWPSREWKNNTKGLPWFPGDSLNVSIGQGFVLATPIQLAMMTGAMATRGALKKPLLARQVGETVVATEIVSQYQALPENWDYVVSAMEAVVHGVHGTAKVISKGLTYRIAGKTGTAQVIGIAEDEEYDRDKIDARNRDHALFIAFSPVDEPRVAMAVIFENGEHGSSKASPVARKVFDEWRKWYEEDVAGQGDSAALFSSGHVSAEDHHRGSL